MLNSMKNKLFIFYFSISILFIAPNTFSQDVGLGDLDKDFLDSLPEEVREDVLSEVDKDLDNRDRLKKRPSSKLQKYKIVQDWEDFQKQNYINNSTERYGLRLFNTMQSSFMPLNEPNFDDKYILDYGDFLTIQLFGNVRNDLYEAEVQRDGSILIEDIGKIVLAGLNFKQAVEIIKQKYAVSFIGVDVAVSLSEVRDINVLITGNVQFPGMYTLSGNSNILQILNIAGGINENGSLREVTIKRSGEKDISIDLYKALIFGDIKNIPFLKSGDSIHIEPVKNLVRAGYGFNKTAIFELKNSETIQDLIYFSGGLKLESQEDLLRIVRFENGKFNSYEINSEQYSNYKTKNLDSVYAYKEMIGTVEISGSVVHPGKYSISSSDRMLDVIKRAGGYSETAYKFAGRLFRESTIELEEAYAKKAYQDIIRYILNNPDVSGNSSGDGIAYLLSELKTFKPIGRVIAEFDEEILKSNIDENIYINDGDKIFIPQYQSNVYVFGEVGNPGSVLFKEFFSISDYIKKSGGLTKFSSKDSIFIVDPNGETTKVNINGMLSFIDQKVEVYPGSVIYVSRNIGKIDGVKYYATIAPIISSLALSIASLNSLD